MKHCKYAKMLHEDDCSKAFEAILAQCGKFGQYQRRLYAIVCAMHIICTSILAYMKFIPNLELKQECTEIIEVEAGNSSFLFLHFNETATFSVNCHTYYDNDIGLELDWTFPEVTSYFKFLVNIVGEKTNILINISKMVALSNFLNSNLRIRECCKL